MPTLTDKLQAAAQLIEEAITQLDTSADPCPCCQRMNSRHYHEYQAHKELSAMARKLRGQAYSLRKLQQAGSRRAEMVCD